MSKGIIDATWAIWEMSFAFKLQEPTNYILETQTSTSTHLLAMNPDTWASLPDVAKTWLDDNFEKHMIDCGPFWAGPNKHFFEVLKEDPEIEHIITALNHQETWTVVMGERAFLNRLEGGCQVPIAAHGKIEKNTFSLCGLVASVDGTIVIKETLSGPEDSSESIGVNLADRLLSKGAKTIMENLSPDFS